MCFPHFDEDGYPYESWVAFVLHGADTQKILPLRYMALLLLHLARTKSESKSFSSVSFSFIIFYCGT